jgi:hypothetical protein
VDSNKQRQRENCNASGVANQVIRVANLILALFVPVNRRRPRCNTHPAVLVDSNKQRQRENCNASELDRNARMRIATRLSWFAISKVVFKISCLARKFQIEQIPLLQFAQ